MILEVLSKPVLVNMQHLMDVRIEANFGFGTYFALYLPVFLS